MITDVWGRARIKRAATVCDSTVIMCARPSVRRTDKEVLGRTDNERQTQAKPLHLWFDDIPSATFVSPLSDRCVRDRLNENNGKLGEDTAASFFHTFESSADQNNRNDDQTTSVTHTGARTRQSGKRRKKEMTAQDKMYRAEREHVKRKSHQKMIWFFRQVGLRHPAAVRTHLERVKHPEFELPNLQCVFPHPELSIAFDEKWETDECGKQNDISTNLTYYNLYCATPGLVEHVRTIMGEPRGNDPDYNKRLITSIADIVGRLLWHHNRTHAVMFAKSDHYDRECFLLYSRQAEPTPSMMVSDSFFCRRHDSAKFQSIAPQPDLTRANSNRLSNESAVYVVGCNFTEVQDSFPYDYRVTNCRPMKALCDRVRKIDPAVVNHAFSAVNKYLNCEREQSPYPEVASRTSFDVLSVLLRDADIKQATLCDDSIAYRDYMERFVTAGVLNIQCMIKSRDEAMNFTGYKNNTNVQCMPSPQSRRLDHLVLHHVGYRKEVRSLRTNRVFYFKNADDFVCSLSLLDDKFENRAIVVDDNAVRRRRPVYFYDVLQAFEYPATYDVNDLVMNSWCDAETMIRESASTIGQYLTADVLNGPLPADSFYPPNDMSPTDVAIDRVLERALKHSKKMKLSTPSLVKNESKKRKYGGNEKVTIGPVAGLSDENCMENTIKRSMSKVGENRLRDGYTSPSRLDFATTVTHNGQEIPIQITVGSGMKQLTRPDYGPRPSLMADATPLCVYIIDPKATDQIRTVPGSRIVDRERRGYVALKNTDRIVRVYNVQVIAETYVIKPYVYFVFRDMPVASTDDSTLDEMFERVKSYEGFQGVKTFDRSGQGNNYSAITNTRMASCFQPQRTETEPYRCQQDSKGLCESDPLVTDKHRPENYDPTTSQFRTQSVRGGGEQLHKPNVRVYFPDDWNVGENFILPDDYTPLLESLNGHSASTSATPETGGYDHWQRRF